MVLLTDTTFSPLDMQSVDAEGILIEYLQVATSA